MSQTSPSSSVKRVRFNGQYLNTTYHYRGAIAEMLGFPPERFSGPLPRPIIERAYHAVLGTPAPEDLNIRDLRRAIARTVGLDAAEYDDPCTYVKADVVGLFEAIRDLPEERLESVIDAGLCPVCDKAYRAERRRGGGFRLGSVSLAEDACLTHDDGVLVEYVHAN